MQQGLLRKPLIFFIASGVLLLVALAFYWYDRTGDSEPGKPMAREIGEKVRSELAIAAVEAEEIVATPSKIWTTTNHPFFLRKDNRIIAWSSNFYEPAASCLVDSGKE